MNPICYITSIYQLKILTLKNVFVITIFAILIFSNFNCANKNEETIVVETEKFDASKFIDYVNENSSNSRDGVIPHFNNVYCTPDFEDCTEAGDITISVKPECTQIPQNVIGDCEVDVNFDLCVDENASVPVISFYNFSLGIPDQNGECSDLLNYLDNLNDEDYEEAISCIADYVKHKAIFDIMESWSGGLFCQGSYLVASSNLHEALCSRICRVGYERPTSGKITGGWWIYFVNCGSGCCQTETEYCWENGTFSVQSQVTISSGDCIQVPPTPWEIEYCFNEKYRCQQRCEN